MPQYISNLYFEFFNNNPPICWRQDIFLLDKLLSPVYNEPYVRVISETFLKGEVENPCTGVIAESFLHFSWIGLLVYPFILYFIVKIWGKVLNKFSYCEKILFCFCFVYIVIDDSITSTNFVLTLIISIFFIYIIGSYQNNMDRNKKYNKERNIT